MSKREGSPAAGGERTWSSETSNGSDVKTPQPLNAFCVNPAAPASKVASALGPATAYETFSSGASDMLLSTMVAVSGVAGAGRRWFEWLGNLLQRDLGRNDEHLRTRKGGGVSSRALDIRAQGAHVGRDRVPRHAILAPVGVERRA